MNSHALEMVLSIPLWATFWFSPNCQDSSRSLTRICLPTTPNCSPGTEPRNMCWKFTLSWIVQATVHGTESRTANAQGSLINLAISSSCYDEFRASQVSTVYFAAALDVCQDIQHCICCHFDHYWTVMIIYSTPVSSPFSTQLLSLSQDMFNA